MMSGTIKRSFKDNEEDEDFSCLINQIFKTYFDCGSDHHPHGRDGSPLLTAKNLNLRKRARVESDDNSTASETTTSILSSSSPSPCFEEQQEQEEQDSSMLPIKMGVYVGEESGNIPIKIRVYAGGESGNMCGPFMTAIACSKLQQLGLISVEYKYKKVTPSKLTFFFHQHLYYIIY